MPTRPERLLASARALRERGGYRFEPLPRASTDPTNPRDPTHDGVTRPLFHRGELVARAADDGATFCCGVTFEAWFDSGLPPNVTPDELRQVLTEWFCPTMGHPGVAHALASRGWGTRVALSDAQPGDLCQFWRSTDLERPSGHSVVFLGHGDGTLRYWSSQRATDGVGEYSEVMSAGWTLHLVRPT